MNHTNAQILSAVLNHWLQPVARQFAGRKLASLPFVQAVENKIRVTGWVSPSWSMPEELSPLMENMTGTLLQPLLDSYLSRIPDEAIPEMAHSLVGKAIADNGLALFEGNLVFEKEDMEELKKLLDYNLPLTKTEAYVVKTAPAKDEKK